MNDSPARNEEEDALPLRGLLRDYFRDGEEINQFIAEERQGWERRERLLDELWERAERQKAQQQRAPDPPTE
jgi:hypothetical protein